MRTTFAAAFVVLGAFACGNSGTSPPVSADGAVGCHVDKDCTQAGTFETCVAAEAPHCGGAPPPQQCVVDKDCVDGGATSVVCVHSVCGGSQCGPKCTGDQSCPSNPPGALACSLTTGQCVQKPCKQPSDCPANYTCTQGACVNKTCTTDADCMGACVDGTCSAGLGVCTPPSA
jgi:hypothetical protein